MVHRVANGLAALGIGRTTASRSICHDRGVGGDYPCACSGGVPGGRRGRQLRSGGDCRPPGTRPGPVHLHAGFCPSPRQETAPVRESAGGPCATGDRLAVRPGRSTVPCATRTLRGKTSFPTGRTSGQCPARPSDVEHDPILLGHERAPKAIPWDQTTPIKSAIDAHLHHDTHPGDVLCWPTNMGWMMGPWLVYATLMNKATWRIRRLCRPPGSSDEFVPGRRGDHARPGSEPGLRVAKDGLS